MLQGFGRYVHFAAPRWRTQKRTLCTQNAWIGWSWRHTGDIPCSSTVHQLFISFPHTGPTPVDPVEFVVSVGSIESSLGTQARMHCAHLCPTFVHCQMLIDSESTPLFWETLSFCVLMDKLRYCDALKSWEAAKRVTILLALVSDVFACLHLSAFVCTLPFYF